MTFLGGLITTLGDSGQLGPGYWATEFAKPAVLSRLRLDPTLSKSSICDPDSQEFPFVISIYLRLCSLSASALFFRFRALVHVVANVARVIDVVTLDVIPVLVVPFVDVVQFPHAPVLTPTAAFAVVALPFL